MAYSSPRSSIRTCQRVTCGLWPYLSHLPLAIGGQPGRSVSEFITDIKCLYGYIGNTGEPVHTGTSKDLTGVPIGQQGSDVDTGLLQNQCAQPDHPSLSFGPEPTPQKRRCPGSFF